MEKKNKIKLAILISLVVILSLFLVGYFTKIIIEYSNQSKKSQEIINEFYELYEKTDKQVVLFASPYCPHCEAFKPTLKELADEYKFSYYIFDVSAVFSEAMAEMQAKTGLNFNGVPYLVVFDDKEVILTQSGNQTREKTLEKLIEIGVIDNE